MTVRELIEQLQQYPPEMEVYTRDGYECGEKYPSSGVIPDRIECIGDQYKDVVLVS